MSDQKGGSGRGPKRPHTSAEDAVVLSSGAGSAGAGESKPSSGKDDKPASQAPKTDATTSQAAESANAKAGSTASGASRPAEAGASADKAGAGGKAKDGASAAGAGDAPKSGPAKAAPPPPPPAKNETSPVVVGVIGGVIGGLAVALLTPVVSGLLPDSMSSPSTESVATRFASQTEALTAAEAALQARLDEFEQSLTQNREAAETAQSGVTGAGERLDKLSSDLTALDGQIDSMNQATVQRESAREQTLGDLRSQVAALAAAIAATPTPTGEAGTVSAPVETRLALLEGAARRLEARINGLSTEALPTPDLSRIDLLETRVRALEARPIGAGGDASLGVAFAGLAQAVAGSAPFETELLTLEKVAGIELPAALGDPAATGLPSATSLATRFDPASVAALQAASMAAAKSKGGDWTEALTNRLAALVVVRRTDEIEGDSPEAIVSRARARLAEGDVRAALIELEPFPQAGRDAMTDWLEDAERRANAETALADLKEKLLGGE